MKELTLTFHGASQTVTGSCYQLSHGGHMVLVDCGLFQGSRSLEALNREAFAFDPAKIDAVVLTHAHLDHSGLLPRLVAEGFRGRIWCTAPTRDLIGEMLPDAARIQEQDAERRNRRPDRADEPPIAPLYTAADADRALQLATAVELGEAFDAAPGFEVRLWNAGHILGSASAEISAAGVRTFFSGDIGPTDKPFHADPQGPQDIDHLVCESTYGNRERDDMTIEQRRSLLETEVKTALARGGNLVIPVFALERTQELLLDLAMLISAGRLAHPKVFVDSPLASRTTDVFRKYRSELEDVGSSEVFDHPAFHFVESVEASMGLNHMSGAVILSASGMCEAGRIRHHLKFNLPRPESTILFVGFQAQGTLGRTLVEGARRVRISGRDVSVRAEIRRIDSYSAHGDRTDLIAWLRAREPLSGSAFLTHGEIGEMTALREAIEPELPSVIIPEIGETYELPPGAAARRLKTGRIGLRPILNRDWQNDYADFTVNLKRRLQAIETSEKRAEAIARMRKLLDEFEAHKQAKRERA